MGRLYRRLEATGCASLEEFSRGLSGEANGLARARAWKRKSEGSRRRFINVSKCRSSRSCAGFLGGDRFGADLKEFRPNIRRFEQDLRRDFNRVEGGNSWRSNLSFRLLTFLKIHHPLQIIPDVEHRWEG